MSPEVLQEIRREGPVEKDEMAQAYAEFSFPELISVYEADRVDELKSRELQNSTVARDVSQMKQAARFLPNNMPAVQLTGENFRDAKKAMFAVPLRAAHRPQLSHRIRKAASLGLCPIWRQ